MAKLKSYLRRYTYRGLHRPNLGEYSTMDNVLAITAARMQRAPVD